MIGKLRPVGNRVPAPLRKSSVGVFPWQRHFATEFTESGTDALAMAIALAVARSPRISEPEVIIPAYGCPDIVAAVLVSGAKPVLVDLVASTSFLMDQSQVIRSLSANTVAIVAPALLGCSERLDSLYDICRDRKLLLIEDSAQRFPPVSADYPWADAVVLSFGRGKPINLMGGGALLIRNECYDEARQVITSFPQSSTTTGLVWRIKRIAFNFLLARFPYFVLDKLPFMNIGGTRFRPRESVKRLDLPRELFFSGMASFFHRPLIYPLYERQLQDIEQLGWRKLAFNESDDEFERVQYPRIRYGLLAPNQSVRDRAERALNESGIGASRFYGKILPEIEGLEAISGRKGSFPAGREFASRLLTLPCHEDVRPADVELIAKILHDSSSPKDGADRR